MGKGQIAVEIMIVFGMLIVLLTVVIIFGFQKNQQVISSQIDSRAEDLTTYIATKINTVYMEGSGFETEMVLPDGIEGKTYVAWIGNNSIIINLQGQSYSHVLLTNNVSGVFTPGTHIVQNQVLGIRVL